MKYFFYLILAFSQMFCLSVFAIEPLKWAGVDYPPAHYVSSTGEIKGYLYDIAIEALEKRMGIPVKISFFPWKRCQVLVEMGESDMLFTIPTPERLEFVVTHEKPAWIKKRVIYTYRGNSRIKEIDEVKRVSDVKNSGLTIMTYRGNSWLKSKIDSTKAFKVEYTNKIDNMYKMLAYGRADLIIEQSSLAEPNIKRLNLENKIIKTRGIGSESNFHILICKRSTHSDLVKQLDQTINEMWLDGTIQRILKKYNQE